MNNNNPPLSCPHDLAPECFIISPEEMRLLEIFQKVADGLKNVNPNNKL